MAPPDPHSPVASVPASSLGWRASFGATLAAAMVLSTFGQSALGPLAPFITADLGLSRSQLGALTTVLFIVGGVCSPLAGRLTDRVGGRQMLLGVFVGSGLSIAAVGVAPSYPWLVAAVALGGLAMAAGNPATNKLLSAHVPAGRQGLLTGVKQSGVQLGAFLAGALLPPTALLVGWRGALLASVSLAVLGALAAARVVPADPRRPRGTPPPRPSGPLSPVVRRLALYAFLMGAGVAATMLYLPLYAFERLAFDETVAGLVAATAGAVGVGARIVWGRSSDRLADLATPLAALAAFAVVSQAAIWASEAAGAWLLWVGAAGFGATAASWNAVGMLAIIKRVEPGDAGRASGLVLLGFFSGFVVSPVAFGYSVDVTGRYDVGWAGVVVVFALAAVAAARWRRTPGTAARQAPVP